MFLNVHANKTFLNLFEREREGRREGEGERKKERKNPGGGV